MAIGDRVRHWRIRNLISVAEKTAEKLSAKNVSLEKCQPLPDGDIIALFSKASEAEGESLSDLWAALLAERMLDEQVEFRTFAKTLEQFSDKDAKLFDALGFLEGSADQSHDVTVKNRSSRLAFLSDTEFNDEKLYRVSTENLLRLGVVENLFMEGQLPTELISEDVDAEIFSQEVIRYLSIQPSVHSEIDFPIFEESGTCIVLTGWGRHLCRVTSAGKATADKHQASQA